LLCQLVFAAEELSRGQCGDAKYRGNRHVGGSHQLQFIVQAKSREHVGIARVGSGQQARAGAKHHSRDLHGLLEHRAVERQPVNVSGGLGFQKSPARRRLGSWRLPAKPGSSHKDRGLEDRKRGAVPGSVTDIRREEPARARRIERIQHALVRNEDPRPAKPGGVARAIQENRIQMLDAALAGGGRFRGGNGVRRKDHERDSLALAFVRGGVESLAGEAIVDLDEVRAILDLLPHGLVRLFGRATTNSWFSETPWSTRPGATTRGSVRRCSRMAWRSRGSWAGPSYMSRIPVTPLARNTSGT